MYLNCTPVMDGNFGHLCALAKISAKSIA